MRDLLTLAFSHVDLDFEEYVTVDEKFVRPVEVDHLLADPAKAKKVLEWEPTVSFEQMVQMMVDADLERLG